MDNLVEIITQNAEGKDLSVLGGTVKLVVDDQIVFVTPDETSISSVTIDCGCKMVSGCMLGGRFLEPTDGTEVPKSLMP